MRIALTRISHVHGVHGLRRDVEASGPRLLPRRKPRLHPRLELKPSADQLMLRPCTAQAEVTVTSVSVCTIVVLSEIVRAHFFMFIFKRNVLHVHIFQKLNHRFVNVGFFYMVKICDG